MCHRLPSARRSFRTHSSPHSCSAHAPALRWPARWRPAAPDKERSRSVKPLVRRARGRMVFGLWRVRFPPCLVRPGRRLPVQGLSEGSLGFYGALTPVAHWPCQSQPQESVGPRCFFSYSDRKENFSHGPCVWRSIYYTAAGRKENFSHGPCVWRSIYYSLFRLLDDTKWTLFPVGTEITRYV